MRKFLSPDECEKWLAEIDAKLANTPFTGVPDIRFNEDLRHLSEIGQMTWYRCDCGPISPVSGTIDVFCTKCGQFLRLGPRLSRSPWPLYVACLRRVRPDDWFKWLKVWMTGHLLCVSESGAYAGRHSVAGAAYLGDSPKSAAGGEAYDGVSHQSLAGAQAPEIIRCIDNMRICANGEIIGLNWIALPMPESAQI